MNMNKPPVLIHRLGWRRAVPTAALGALVWWALTEGAGAWIFGAVVIAAATGAALLLTPRGTNQISVTALPRFVAFFLRESWRGGFDVGRRALHPRLSLAPGLLEYRLRLPPGGARIFLFNVVSLLPGTLSTDFDESNLTVHVLDRDLPVLAEIEQLEAQVAALFGIELEPIPEARHD